MSTSKSEFGRQEWSAMSRNGICPRCGGKGTVWTGHKRIACPEPNCSDGRVIVR